ncbi:MAG TPA: hypothetical protein VKC34_18735 [Blastocatellia bacterium]|nr:hypothetical protein [Blastocatellia bacterium]
MKGFKKVFALGFTLITGLFVVCAFSLIAFSVMELWGGINPGNDIELRSRFNSILESIGLLTIAVAALELGQTILEEEVRREAEMSVPTRIRRFLSRFLIVIIVSLSIEFLVAVFQLIHENPAQLPQASWVGIATAALLVAWGLFIKLNKSAEELEPEAMEQVKREDKQM